MTEHKHPDDGGSAYPFVVQDLSKYQVTEPGMSLRAKFAETFAAAWLPKTPKGWRFTTADFSMLPGRVMFIRDAAEKERWHELPDIDKEREDGPELYVSGSGMTLQEAFAKACAAAERAQPLPSPPDSRGAGGL